MCGIAGEIRFDGLRANARAVARMCDAQACRGPDGEGFHESGWVAFGHRRLTVIDHTEASAQPMTDEDDGLTLVFNGCIYNYRQLRRELEDERAFRSSGDTEVVLRAYERWGDEFVQHLVGMFAIAIFDRRRDAVILVRDRLGIKPLYLAAVDGGLRFASHLPALLAAGGVDTALDPVALHNYFSWHSIVPAPRTVLTGIRKLPAATVRVIRSDGTASDHLYWQPEYARDPARSDWSALDWEEAIEGALRLGIARRLVADVPVGILLSGGLDSSLLVAINRDLGGPTPHTFSIGFEDGHGVGGDEFRYSDVVADEFGTIHHQIVVSQDDLPGAVAGSIEAMSEPMASHDVAAFYLLSESVARTVKVVQCGQGADEVFAGYAYHGVAAGIPRENAVDALTDSFFDRAHSALQTIAAPGALPEEDVSRDQVARHLSMSGAETALDAILRLDTHLLMVDDPVKRLDSMTMSWSVEARVPFLDHDLVALAARCPPALKLGEGGKGLLKRIGRRLLPPEVVDRPKGYFPLPALQSLDGPVLELARDALSSPSARMRQVIRPEVIDRLLDDPNADRTQVGGTTLWPIVVLELWLQAQGVG